VPNKRGKSRAAVSRPRPVQRVAGRGRGTGTPADKPTAVERGRKTVAGTARACAARAVRRKGSTQSKDRKRPSRQRKTSPAAAKLKRANSRRRTDSSALPPRVTSASPEKTTPAGQVAAIDAASPRGQFVAPDSISDAARPPERPVTRHRLGHDRPSFLRKGPRIASLGVAAAAIVGASVITMTVLHGVRGGSSPVGHVDPSLAAPAPSSQVAPRTLGAAPSPTSKRGSTHCAGCASAPNPGPVLLGGDLPSSSPAGAPGTFGAASDVAPSLAGVGNTGAPSSSGSAVTPSRTSSSARPTSASPRPSSRTPTPTPTSKPPTTTPTTPHTTPATTPATTPPTTTPTPTPTPTSTP
jgi:hypothetical protein